MNDIQIPKEIQDKYAKWLINCSWVLRPSMLYFWFMQEPSGKSFDQWKADTRLNQALQNTTGNA